MKFGNKSLLKLKLFKRCTTSWSI